MLTLILLLRALMFKPEAKEEKVVEPVNPDFDIQNGVLIGSYTIKTILIGIIIAFIIIICLFIRIYNNFYVNIYR